MLMIISPSEASGASLLIGADCVGILLGCSGRTVYRWAAARKMPPAIATPGGETVWRRKDIEGFVACGCSMPRWRLMRSKN